MPRPVPPDIRAFRGAPDADRANDRERITSWYRADRAENRREVPSFHDGSNAQNMPPRTSSTSPVEPAQIGTLTTYRRSGSVRPVGMCSQRAQKSQPFRRWSEHVFHLYYDI